MKIVIYGTGNYYELFRKYIDNDDIAYLVDNSKEKQGLIIHDKLVMSPRKLEAGDYDCIIILIKKWSTIKQQLIDSGVSEEKIYSYSNMGALFHKQPLVHVDSGRLLYWDDWYKDNEKKLVILFFENFSRTGVPVAMMNMAKLLHKMGYSVICISQEDGNLEEELQECNIPFIDNFIIWTDHELFLKNMLNAKAFIVGSVIQSELVQKLLIYNKPILWWLHESDSRWYENQICPNDINNSIRYLLGGTRVKEALYKHFGELETKELLYYLPDLEQDIKHNKVNKKMVFSVMGTICARKAQDILATAVSKLRNDGINEFIAEFVGSIADKELMSKLNKLVPDGIFINELTQSELDAHFDEIDVLVCPSRDDPMPIVVTQAMQHGVLCIVSDQVGQSEYIKSGLNGFVFHNEDIDELMMIMKGLLTEPDEIINIGIKGKEIFQEHFSENKMREELAQLLSKK